MNGNLERARQELHQLQMAERTAKAELERRMLQHNVAAHDLSLGHPKAFPTRQKDSVWSLRKQLRLSLSHESDFWLRRDARQPQDGHEW